MLNQFKFGIENKTIYISVAAFITLIIIMIAVYFFFFRKKASSFGQMCNNDQHTE